MLAVVRVMERRAKLLGLDASTEFEGQTRHVQPVDVFLDAPETPPDPEALPPLALPPEGLSGTKDDAPASEAVRQE